jgi:hypothetical protein
MNPEAADDRDMAATPTGGRQPARARSASVTAVTHACSPKLSRSPLTGAENRRVHDHLSLRTREPHVINAKRMRHFAHQRAQPCLRRSIRVDDDPLCGISHHPPVEPGIDSNDTEYPSDSANSCSGERRSAWESPLSVGVLRLLALLHDHRCQDANRLLPLTNTAPELDPGVEPRDTFRDDPALMALQSDQHAPSPDSYRDNRSNDPFSLTCNDLQRHSRRSIRCIECRNEARWTECRSEPLARRPCETTL